MYSSPDGVHYNLILNYWLKGHFQNFVFFLSLFYLTSQISQLTQKYIFTVNAYVCKILDMLLFTLFVESLCSSYQMRGICESVFYDEENIYIKKGGDIEEIYHKVMNVPSIEF